MDKFIGLVFSLLVLFFLLGPKLREWLWKKAPQKTPQKTPLQQLEEAVALCRLYGVKVDRKKLDDILEKTHDEIVDSEKTLLDNSDQLHMAFADSVVGAETREEAAARQQREQEMFGNGVPRLAPDKDK